MITCCRGCTERRMKCHAWGECVHYMTQKYKQDMIVERRMLENAAAYDSYQMMVKNKDAYNSRKYGRDKKI